MLNDAIEAFHLFAPPDIAPMRDGHLVVLGLNRKETFLDYDAKRNYHSVAKRDADAESLAIAYYQTAFELFRADRF